MIPEVRERYDQVRNWKIPQGYKQTAVGIVPQDWTEYSLGEVYTERKQAGDPSLPVLSVSIHTGVSDGELDEETLGKKVKRIEDKTQYRTALEGDLVFNMMRAWQGAIGIVRSRGLVSPAYIVAKPGDRIYPPFMDYYMQTPRMINLIQRMSYGVTAFRLRLYWDSFEQIPCVLPPLHEQKRIVEILRAQDTIIDLGQQRIEQIKRMKKALLKKMFPQKESFLPEIRFSGFTAPWEQRKLEEVVSLRGRIGFRGYTQTDLVDAGEGAITFSPADIDDSGKVSLTDNKYISWVKYEESPEIKVQVGDILFTKTASIGKVGFVRELREKATINPQFALLTPNGETDGYFTFLSVRTDEFMKKVRDITGGSSVPTMSQEKLKELTFMAPSLVEQKSIGDLISSLDSFITLHQRELEEEQRKKKALMQLLLTGLVRVNA